MADISIKDAPLINNISGTEKIPVSDGSGKPAAITVNQILDKVDLSDYVTTETLNQAVQAVNSNINNVNQNINSTLQNVNQKADKANTTATNALNLAEGIQGSLSSFALKSELPTKVSQLENDADYYITEEQLTQKGYITGEALNQFQETIMSGPIQAINNNLSNNYYTKSEVDAKILELQTLINNYINGTSQPSELDT